MNTTDCGKKNPFVCAKSNTITEPETIDHAKHIEPEVEEEILVESIQIELPVPKSPFSFALFVGIILGIIFIGLLVCLLRFVCCLKRNRNDVLVPVSTFNNISETHDKEYQKEKQT